MTESNYLASLKNREFLLLQRLCDPSISLDEKTSLEKELEETRLEIEKLG